MRKIVKILARILGQQPLPTELMDFHAQLPTLVKRGRVAVQQSLWQAVNDPAIRINSAVDAFIARLAAAHEDSSIFNSGEWAHSVNSLLTSVTSTNNYLDKSVASVVLHPACCRVPKSSLSARYLPQPKPSKKWFKQWHAMWCKFAAIAARDGTTPWEIANVFRWPVESTVSGQLVISRIIPTISSLHQNLPLNVNCMFAPEGRGAQLSCKLTRRWIIGVIGKMDGLCIFVCCFTFEKKVESQLMKKLQASGKDANTDRLAVHFPEICQKAAHMVEAEDDEEEGDLDRPDVDSEDEALHKRARNSMEEELEDEDEDALMQTFKRLTGKPGNKRGFW
ncbi:hypothetical protein SERLADRAFT_404628 [Serpula lacrymans var. lacrymans S7.9]|uniref:Uncharacterized protein n=1 Tax=Serpula lacrymans var. lacrymans (strain S7.9) TaxID=578457 RepID=F8NE96_SERL9|nr:uncharacterized protein SERLADRAFT_404628 [Serpula lacrymans var. lacrymans S7.9]EGO30478.1 hypothetical protein SERLADRAFT_404628 [Serpula lacrymans var. lacrymans S7.9]